MESITYIPCVRPGKFSCVVPSTAAHLAVVFVRVGVKSGNQYVNFKLSIAPAEADIVVPPGMKSSQLIPLATNNPPFATVVLVVTIEILISSIT